MRVLIDTQREHLSGRYCAKTIFSAGRSLWPARVYGGRRPASFAEIPNAIAVGASAPSVCWCGENEKEGQRRTGWPGGLVGVLWRGAICSTRPWFMTTMRSASAIASRLIVRDENGGRAEGCAGSGEARSACPRAAWRRDWRAARQAAGIAAGSARARASATRAAGRPTWRLGKRSARASSPTSASPSA